MSSPILARSFGAGVRHLLGSESDFEVFEASTFPELSEALEENEPDIALIDLELPPSGGIGAFAHLAPLYETRLIVWGFDGTNDARPRLGHRRREGLSRRRKSRRLGSFVRWRVVRGEAPLSRGLATLMIDAVQGLQQRDRARERAVTLSSREREVLELVASGARNRQIAQALSISEFTVKRHMQNILHKLDLPTRRAAGSSTGRPSSRGSLEMERTA